MGGQVTVTVTGNPSPQDFVSIVPKGSPEGTYGEYQYATGGPLKLNVPPKAGEYEIRLLSGATPYPTLARRPIKVESVGATLEAPSQVAAGAKFAVRWTGPNNQGDYVGLGDVDPKGRPYISYSYTNAGSNLEFSAPDQAGEYELRYFLGTGDEVIARRRITVGAVTASVSAPASVAAGANFSVDWKGPNNPRDFVTIVKAGAAAREYGPYAYTSKGNTLELRAPDQPGDYEVRYLTGQSYATLGAAKITVTPNTATLQAPAEAIAGSTFPVEVTVVAGKAVPLP